MRWRNERKHQKSMDIEADIIEFRVPTENDKTIFIWDIQPSFSEAYVYESLWSVYSVFGALYLVKVCPNAAVAAPGFYALVKFYSSAQASKAQRATDRQCLFQSCPLKVRISTKQNPIYLSGSKPLSRGKCQDLANHYLGFNGWSTHIVTLKDISNCSDVGWSPDLEGAGELLKYGCVVELSFPHHGIKCRGVGVAEDVIDPDKGLEQKLRMREKLMKWARNKAVVGAFEKIFLIVLGNGKVAIERKFDQEDVLPDENIEGIIKIHLIPVFTYPHFLLVLAVKTISIIVNDVSWSEMERNDEEDEDLSWDFTVDLPVSLQQ